MSYERKLLNRIAFLKETGKNPTALAEAEARLERHRKNQQALWRAQNHQERKRSHGGSPFLDTPRSTAHNDHSHK